MSTSQITVLKLRQLKQCDITSRVVSRLPGGCTEDLLKFNVSIPTKLWKVIMDRRDMAVRDVSRRYASVSLLPVRDVRDLSVSDGTIGLLSRHIPTGLYCFPNAVLVKPVSAEEFSRYGLRTSYVMMAFDDPDDFNISVVVEGLTESGVGVGRAIFTVGRFPDVLTERPLGALVSYTINV